MGEHGLPLMGTGDWNDGMNRVGEGGKGESVWLAWILHKALMEWIPIATARGDNARSASWLTHTAALKSARRRARPGTASGTGVAILTMARRSDLQAASNAASTASRSPGASCRALRIPARAARAMAAVEEHLILMPSKLALLFTPPFDKTPLEPGYIKGYPPGIRENGGQYTHAATWSIFAFAGLGQGDRASQLFSMLNPINHARTRAAGASL
jgi:cyclic beta-1,2-glucan synthetase